MKVEFEFCAETVAVSTLCGIIGFTALYFAFPDHSIWPKTSSDWAGWVQAAGATVGLGVAIWVSGGPYRQEKKNAVIAARYFAKSLVESTTAFGCGLHDNKIAVIALTNIALAEMIDSIRGVRTELLPPNAMNALATIRNIAVQISVMAKIYEENATADGKSDFLIFLRHIASHIDGASLVLYSDINGIPSEKFSSKEIANGVIKSFEEIKAMASSNDSMGASSSKRE